MKDNTGSNDDSGKGQSTPDSDGKGQSTQTTAPKTGDEANVTLWAILMLAAVCAAGGLGISSRSGRDAEGADMKSGFRLAAVFLAVICLGAAAFLGWNILRTEHEYRAGISAYDQIAEIAGGTDGTEAVGNKGPGGIPASVGPAET